MISRLSYILTGKDKVKLFFIFILIVGGSFLELASVAIFQPFIDMLMNPETAHENRVLRIISSTLSLNSYEQFLTAMCLIIIAVYIIKNIFIWCQNYYTISVSFNMQRQNANRLLTAYMKAPFTFHLNRNVSELQRNMQSDVTNFSTLIITSMQLLNEIVVCVALGILLFIVSNSMAVVIGLLLVICVGSFTKITRRMTQRLGENRRYYQKNLIQWLRQAFGGIKEIKVLNRESFFIEKYQKYQKLYIITARKKTLIASSSKHIVEVVAMTGLLLAIIVKINFGSSDTQAFLSQLAVFAVAAFRLLPSASRLNEGINNIVYAYPSVKMLYNDLREIESIEKNKEAKIEKPIHVNELHIKDAIVCKNICFSYPNTDEKVLNDASLIIPKGMAVAFVGSSGAGKTTMADIILGILKPQAGQVLADDMDIFENIDLWHRQIGYIPQHIYLSDDSIRNNVAFGIKEDLIDEQAVASALRKAQLLDFAMGLADGLDTFVGDQGIRLSGGQRQRIGIARALYHDPEILVLDEATSALDNETEAAVMDAVESLKGIKTMIIIAHRLTTIRNVDIVYEIAEGKITERVMKAEDFE